MSFPQEKHVKKKQKKVDIEQIAIGIRGINLEVLALAPSEQSLPQGTKWIRGYRVWEFFQLT
jgi:hypothetical protein